MSEVALGCALLADRAVTAEFDGLVRGVFGRAVAITGGDAAAARMRRVRALAGPVPAWYPVSRSAADVRTDHATPTSSGVRTIDETTWRAAEALCVFSTALQKWVDERPARSGGGIVCVPLSGSTREMLRWGDTLRPSPQDLTGVRVVPPLGTGLMWRSWMRLPGETGNGIVVIDRNATAPLLRRSVWRGVHDGAHLDHLVATATATGAGAAGAAPAAVEFGTGLLTSEAYAMAVEIVAAVSAALAGERAVVAELCRGITERVGRLPGARRRIEACPALAPARWVRVADYEMLPTLAESYVGGPLRLLAGSDIAAATGHGPVDRLPPPLAAGLRERWAEVTALCAPARTLGKVACSLW